jgi:hypothetical protein|tara:strand:+ start:2154 stop:2681 length:528 start_codon:yes stop_codon:yes gene_type:complete
MTEQLGLFDVTEEPPAFTWGSALVRRTGREPRYWGFGDEAHVGKTDTHTNLKVLFRKLVDNPEKFYAFKPYAFDEFWLGEGRPSFHYMRRHGAMLYELIAKGPTVELIEHPCDCKRWAPVGADYECDECTRFMEEAEFMATFPEQQREYMNPKVLGTREDGLSHYGDQTFRVVVG